MFLKYPHTPHLAWLASGSPREDKVLDRQEAAGLLAGHVLVEEKVDGANIGLSVQQEKLRVQNRGEYLLKPAHAQFALLWAWLAERERRLVEALGERLILFGEWCFAAHSLNYDKLPDWFLGFDIYDRQAGRYWAADRRDEWLGQLGICSVPRIAEGRFSLADLQSMLNGNSSRLRTGPPEGLYLRKEKNGWLEQRAKLVRPEFVQAMGDHWSRQTIRRNRLARRA